MKKYIAVAVLMLGATLANAQKFDNVKITNRQDSEQTYVYATQYVAGNLTVTGSTLTLLLPDGREAVVNCSSKFAEHFAGHAGNRRSCRVPLTDTVEVEFKGDKAKIIWITSLDGKKKESETYKVIGVFSGK